MCSLPPSLPRSLFSCFMPYPFTLYSFSISILMLHFGIYVCNRLKCGIKPIECIGIHGTKHTFTYIEKKNMLSL